MLQERMRYAMDTGTLPPPRRPRRLMRIAFFGLASGLIAFASYANRGAEPSKSDPVLQPSAKAVAWTNPETGRKRSFTRDADPEPTPAVSEPSPPLGATALRERHVVAEPATTGAVTPPARAAVPPTAREAAPDGDRTAPRQFAKRPAPPVRLSTEQAMPERRIEKAQDEPRRSAKPQVEARRIEKQQDEPRRSAKPQVEARRSAVADRSVERAAPPSAYASADRPEPRPVVARPRPERIAAVAPARKVSVCLYFVVCF
jgi:hypothetical protein